MARTYRQIELRLLELYRDQNEFVRAIDSINEMTNVIHNQPGPRTDLMRQHEVYLINRRLQFTQALRIINLEIINLERQLLQLNHSARAA